MRPAALVAFVASLSSVSAVSQGFNYGALNSDGSVKDQATYEAEFKAAKNLVGTSGFTSARLYTTIQGGTTNTPISAIPAAIAQQTTLLLGIWASAGQAVIDSELVALKAAIAQYGTAFTSLVTGISVGNEDLYRISPTGIINLSGAGAEPDVLANYIAQVRSALAGTALSGVGIGHVDTWTAWVNGSNSAVTSACDWIGTDAYPYFQNTMSNSIDNAASLFDDAYQATVAAAGGKPVWITETGWPTAGKTQNLAIPSVANAQTYWQQVGCKYFGKVNTYWYTLFDGSSSPAFGIVGSTLSSTPLFDLSCDAVVIASAATTAGGSQTTPVTLPTNAGGLSPTGAGNGGGAAVVSSSAGAAVTGSGSGSGSGTTVATMTTTVVSSGNSTSNGGKTTSTSAPLSTGGATLVSGPLVGGALGAVLAIMAAL